MGIRRKLCRPPHGVLDHLVKSELRLFELRLVEHKLGPDFSERTLDPARMFTGSLNPGPELENSQGHERPRRLAGSAAEVPRKPPRRSSAGAAVGYQEDRCPRKIRLKLVLRSSQCQRARRKKSQVRQVEIKQMVSDITGVAGPASIADTPTARKRGGLRPNSESRHGSLEHFVGGGEQRRRYLFDRE